MTQITAPWLAAKATQDVAAFLQDAGHQAWFVGGCVRNTLLGTPVSDIDMCTDAWPEHVMDLAKARGLKVIPTGLQHGTVTVLAGGTAHEITTFRRDITTDGRHAEVAFALTLDEDAKRRDFTMNALYADASGNVRDPVDGLADLRDRKVRFIGQADLRIAEDYLRILRFFRFHAWYGDPSGGLDADGLAATAGAAAHLDRLSGARIGTEMTKLLAAPDPAPAIAAMARSGILARVMPGAQDSVLPILIHLENLIHPENRIRLESGRAADWRRRAAALGGEVLKTRWRLSNGQAARIDLLTKHSRETMPLPELAYRHGGDLAWDVALIRGALMGTQLPQDAAAQIASGAQATFPITGRDLKDRYEGAALGRELRQREARWIASGFALDRAALLV